MQDIKAFAKARAREIGFHAVGFAHVEPLPQDSERLRRWLDRGCHGGMSYLERWTDVRKDPSHPGMLPEARTIISLALAYPLAGEHHGEGVVHLLARYARGPDYHSEVRRRLKELLRDLKQHVPDLRGRALVDTAPLFERAWAQRAGLGWIGRNTCLIHPDLGSGFVLGELLLSAELEPDEPLADRCGECHACVDSCPTGALRRPDGRQLDARRCLSYWTIEAKEALPEHLDRSKDLFGCDACQSACPWNQRKRDPTPESPLTPHPRWKGLTLQELARLTLTEIEALIEGTSLKRTGAERLRERARKVAGVTNKD